MSGIHQGPERVIPFSFFRQRWNYELTRVLDFLSR